MAVLRKVLVGSVLTVVLGGCTYVFPQEYERHVSCLDEDGDGFVKRASCETLEQGEPPDCDDTRADRAPDIDEEGDPQYWYDGVDNDCDGQDVIDADGDGWPGILEADWTAQHGNLSYPSGLEQSETDCDDTNAQTFPGSEFEEPYDGVDSDCEGDDDFDADGDGHVPPADRLPPGSATYDGDLPQDDCDDSDPDVHPGTDEPDVWYDGEDTDCDGANDFDQDGDGYIRQEDVAAYEAFLSYYDYADDRACTDDDEACDDCDDDPSDDASQPVPASAVNPGANETWYDGVDQDCAGDNDFDQDHDGYLCDGSVVSACSGSTGTDCVDDDSTINPGALELLGDTIDQDCDTVDDGAIFHYGGLRFNEPSGPRVARTDAHYLLGVVATALDDGQVDSNVGLVYTFDTSIADASGTITNERDFAGEVTNIVQHAPGLGLVGRPDAFYVSHAVDEGSTNRRQRLVRYDHFPGVPGDYVNPGTLATSDAKVADIADYDDFDLQVDDASRQWAVACSPTTVNLLVADNDGDTLVEVEELACASTNESDTRCPTTAVDGGIACYIDPDTGDVDTAHVHLFSSESASSHRAFVLDIGTDTSSLDGTLTECTTGCDDWADLQVSDVNHREGALALAGTDPSGSDGSAADANGFTLYDLGQGTSIGAFGTSYDVVTVDAWKVDDTHWYVVALVEDLGTDGLRDVVLFHGDPASFESAVLNVTDPGHDLDPTGVSVFADADRVMIGITAEGPSTVDYDDVLGWSFLGFAP